MKKTHEENILFLHPKQPTQVPQTHERDPLAPTIFHEAWWLDIVTNGTYKMVEVEENGEVVGRLPYFPKERFGLRYSMMPVLTHFIGPAVVPPPEGSHTTVFLRRTHIIQELLKKLPDLSVYQYKCHADIDEAIAFQRERFMVNVQFTYEVHPAEEETLWKNMRVEKRKKIKQAQKLHTITHIDSGEEFWRFYNSNCEKKGLTNLYGKGICSILIQACLDRKRGYIYAAKDQNNDITAMVLCIWDAKTMYYFMSSRTPESHNGVVSLLVWEAMKDAARRGLVFDFDGLNTGNVMLYITEFGGIIKPRYIVTRATTLGRLALAIRGLKNPNRYFC